MTWSLPEPMIKKIVRGRDCPWLTTDIKSKMKERDFLEKSKKKWND